MGKMFFRCEKYVFHLSLFLGKLSSGCCHEFELPHTLFFHHLIQRPPRSHSKVIKNQFVSSKECLSRLNERQSIDNKDPKCVTSLEDYGFIFVCTICQHSGWKKFLFFPGEKSLSLENDKSKIVKMNDDKERREHQCP